MVKNLNQLKKSLKTGTRFQITNHCRPECVGQLREVTVSNTQGFYSILLWWSKAPFWQFTDGICSIYNSDTKSTEDTLIMSFRVLGEEAA